MTVHGFLFIYFPAFVNNVIEFAECSECGRELEPKMVLFCTTYPDRCPACKVRMGARTTAENVDEGTWMPEAGKK